VSADVSAHALSSSASFAMASSSDNSRVYSAQSLNDAPSSNLLATSRHQPALSRFIGTPQRTFSLSSSQAPVFSDSASFANPQTFTTAVAVSAPSFAQPSLSSEPASSMNSSFHASSTNNTPSSLFKSPFQMPLAPSVPHHSYVPSDADSAAARFVSSLSETHLQTMLSDLLVEKNALAKVKKLCARLFSIHHVTFWSASERFWERPEPCIRTAFRCSQLPRDHSFSEN
jgi:hypothetical protein